MVIPCCPLSAQVILFKSTFLTIASEKGGSTTAFHMFVHVCWLEALTFCIFSTDDLLSAPLKMLQMVLVDTQVTKTSSNSWLNIIATATRMKFGLKVCSFPPGIRCKNATISVGVSEGVQFWVHVLTLFDGEYDLRHRTKMVLKSGLTCFVVPAAMLLCYLSIVCHWTRDTP